MLFIIFNAVEYVLSQILNIDHGFHHNSYYASAYTPHAVHKAALIQYLLSGTAFELSKILLTSHLLLSVSITHVTPRGV